MLLAPEPVLVFGVILLAFCENEKREEKNGEEEKKSLTRGGRGRHSCSPKI